MEHKIVDTFVRYIHRKMPSDTVMNKEKLKEKKSPTEKTNKFKEYFGSHHDLRIFGSHAKRNVSLICRYVFTKPGMLVKFPHTVFEDGKFTRIKYLNLLLFSSTSVLIVSNNRMYLGVSSLIRLFYVLSFCWSTSRYCIYYPKKVYQPMWRWFCNSPLYGLYPCLLLLLGKRLDIAEFYTLQTI